MDARIVVALMSPIISAVAGLLGALIGYRGAQRTTQRNIDFAREQRRFERAQEMRAEVIPKLFVLLENQAERLAWALDLPGRVTEEGFREIVGAFLEGRGSYIQPDAQLNEWVQGQQSLQSAHETQSKKLTEYFLLHRIWLPEALASAFAELADEYDEHWMKMYRAVEEWGARGKRRFTNVDSEEVIALDDLAPEELKALDEYLNQEKEFYEARVRDTRDWFEGERLRREAAMWSAARQVLAVEE
jgi:hypothetical protein